MIKNKITKLFSITTISVSIIIAAFPYSASASSTDNEIPDYVYDLLAEVDEKTKLETKDYGPGSNQYTNSNYNIQSDRTVNISDRGSVYIPQSDSSHWKHKEDGSWCYYDQNGEMVTGFYAMGPSIYYLFDSETGASLSGWQEIDGNMYYFEPSEEGYVMALNKIVDGCYVNSKGIKENAPVKVQNENDAINLIKQNDSNYIKLQESAFGSLTFQPYKLEYSTLSYLNSPSNLTKEPMYKISLVQNQNGSLNEINRYFVGTLTGKVYCAKPNFEFAYEINNNAKVSTVNLNHIPALKFNTNTWR